MLPIYKNSLKERLQQYGRQQMKDQPKKGHYSKVFQVGKYDGDFVERLHIIALSNDNQVLFAASETKNSQDQFKKKFLKFYDIRDNQIVESQIISSKFQANSVSSCAFMKDNSLIIAWKNWEIQVWEKAESGVWQMKSIIHETQGKYSEYMFPLNKILLNKQENLLIISGYGLYCFSKTNKTWNLIEKQFDYCLESISYNETENFLIGKQRSNPFNYIVIIELLPNYKWMFKRKINFDPHLNYKGLSIVLLMEVSLIYNNQNVLWNKWSGKLIKKRYFHKQETIHSINSMKNMIVIVNEESMSIYNLENNDLILQDTYQIAFNCKNTFDDQHFTEISNDGKLIIMFREWEKIIYRRF